MTASNDKTADLEYRPSLHLTSSKGWINDPNGLIWFEGEFHQFYQYYPDDTVWGPMHWGHQTSKDLITWIEHKTALFPDENGMCFSGSAILDKFNDTGLFASIGGLVVFYTSFVEKELELADGSKETQALQHQSLAYSNDGYNWKKYNDGAPVLKSRGNPDFRDPKVFWHAQSTAWVMVIACGQHIEIYRSTNLIDWQLSSEFGHVHGAHSEGPWECPDLFELNDKQSGIKRWFLIVGIGDGAYGPGSGTQYFVGHFDGYVFTSEYPKNKVLWLDYGRDYYAAQSFSNEPNSRRVISAWMSNHQYAHHTPTHLFRGVLTVPRQLELVVGDDKSAALKQQFVDELRNYFKTHECLPVSLIPTTAYQISEAQTTCIIELRCDLQEDDELELSLFRERALTYNLRKENGALTVNSSRISANSSELRAHGFEHNYSTTFPFKEQLRLQLLVDQGCTCLVINEEHVFTNLCFPEKSQVHVEIVSMRRELFLLLELFTRACIWSPPILQD